MLKELAEAVVALKNGFYPSCKRCGKTVDMVHTFLLHLPFVENSCGKLKVLWKT